MKLAHIYSRLLSTPWFVNEATLSAVTQLLQSRMNGGLRTQPQDFLVPEKTSARSLPASATGTAIIQVFGVLGKHLSEMETMCGGCDMNSIREAFDVAMADPKIKQVVMYFDSPGGMATGCHELFTHMIGTKSKPLYAYTDTILGSAAYYLACAADAIYAAPTARVGSIGTILTVVDESEKNAAEGVKLIVFKSGDFKGMPSEPITPQETALIQGMVDQLGERFRSDVRASRPSIAEEDLQGQDYLGTRAKEKGFVDDVVNDFPALLAGLR